uniref:Uncharacterized protein n=1 Tax=Anopheles maculatus TaxID=74869 RepID=A0A182SWK6_9DIPT
PAVKINAAVGNTYVEDDDDDDQDDTPFDEERSNALNDSSNHNLPTLEHSFTDEGIVKPSAPNTKTSEIDVPEPEQNQASSPSPTTPSADEAVTGDTLKDQMDELVRNYNKLAESLNVPTVEEAPVEVQETVGVQKNQQIKPTLNSKWKAYQSSTNHHHSIERPKKTKH